MSGSIVYVGSYASGPAAGPGGIDVLRVEADGTDFTALSRVETPEQAGYLVYSAELSTVYAVDERKTDGRGSVAPAASVHSFSAAPGDGRLTPLNSIVAPGPFPTYLGMSAPLRKLVSANHGSFDHVEHVVKTADGWGVEYLYDHSTVILFDLELDGSVSRIADLEIFAPGGTDPNSSPQAGGHGQASGHAHCAVVDPSGRWVVVGDKAADHLTVFALTDRLDQAARLQLPAETGPRHAAFATEGDRLFVTCEFASTLMSLSFDPRSGVIERLDEVATTAEGFDGLNEPADVRIHPSDRFVYVNNRGEDTLAWFRVSEDGGLTRAGHVDLAPSVHPGLAARSFAFSPDGSVLIVADRPANLVRSYAVDVETGELHPVGEFAVADPAFVAFGEDLA